MLRLRIVRWNCTRLRKLYLFQFKRGATGAGDALRSRVFFEPPALDGVSLTIPGFGSSKPSEFAPLPVVAGLMRVADAQVIAAFELVLQLNICSLGLSSAGLLVGTLNWLAKQGEPKESDMPLCRWR